MMPCALNRQQQGKAFGGADRATRLILFIASSVMYDVLSTRGAPSTYTSAEQMSRPTTLLAQHEYRPRSSRDACLTRRTHSPSRISCIWYLPDGRTSWLPWYHCTCNHANTTTVQPF